MSSTRQSHDVMGETSMAGRLIVGIPALLIGATLCATTGWARLGFPADLEPHRWGELGIPAFLGLAFVGGITIAFGAGMLWLLGIVAMACGEVILRGFRQLGFGKPRGTATR